jgi:hypothetical protein
MTLMTEMHESTNTSDLMGLLSEQRELYRQLGQLAGGQRALITGESPERLLGVLVQRQRVIDRLEDVTGRLRPYQRKWRSVRSSLSPEDGRRADQIVAEVNGLLKGILEKDAADAELLAARKSSVGQSLQSVKTARHAGTAYGGGQPASGSRIDWMDE